MEFDWDGDNIDHIARHHLEPEEIEEAVHDPNRKPIDVYNNPSEKRRGLLGKTENGRLIAVILTVRIGKDGQSLLRCVTARDANKTEQRIYRG